MHVLRPRKTGDRQAIHICIAMVALCFIWYHLDICTSICRQGPTSASSMHSMTAPCMIIECTTCIIIGCSCAHSKVIEENMFVWCLKGNHQLTYFSVMLFSTNDDPSQTNGSMLSLVSSIGRCSNSPWAEVMRTSLLGAERVWNIHEKVWPENAHSRLYDQFKLTPQYGVSMLMSRKLTIYEPPCD